MATAAPSRLRRCRFKTDGVYLDVKQGSKSARKWGAVVGGTVGGAALGWMAWSKFGIDHRRRLEPAIDATRTEFLSSRVGKLSFYEDRSVRGRPLVLLHSVNAAASAYEVRPIFQHFRRQRPVFALDLPGFGFSGRSDRVYSPELYVHALLDWIQNAVDANESVDVVALSLTGEFVARAAYERPSLFRSITLVSPTGFGQPFGASSEFTYRAFRLPLWSQAVYDLLVTPPSIQHYLKKTFHGPVDRGLADYAYATSHQPGARNAPLYFMSGKLFTPDVREAYYAQLSVPCLVLHDEDEYVSFDELPTFLERLPNWSSARIAPTKGMPHFEKPAETFQVLEQFWRSRLTSFERVEETAAEEHDWLSPN